MKLIAICDHRDRATGTFLITNRVIRVTDKATHKAGARKLKR
jgi:hypothetical protein